MEGNAKFTSTAVTVYDDYQVAFPPMNPSVEVEGPSMAAFPPPMIMPPSFPTSTGNSKKKRGRPRKYGPDYSSGPIFSPVPISAIPLPPEEPNPAEKRASKSESETSDDPSPFHRGRNCTLHIITVYAGEDVGMKITKAFSKSRAITVLSAIGSISLVTIRKPDVVEGRVIHEISHGYTESFYAGHFEIVSLNGSFMPTKNGSLMSRCGGLSVYLVDGEGKTIAGALAGMLIAKSDVMVTVANFLPSGSNQRKRKRAETEPSSGPDPTMGPPRSKKPMNPNEGQMSSSQAGLSAQPGSSQYSGPSPIMGPPRNKEPMNPNGGQMSSSQAGPSTQPSSSQSSGPGPTMGLPRSKDPMNLNGGQTPNFSPLSQAGSLAQHSSSRSLGPSPTMGPPRCKEPLNPNGGQMLNFLPASSSQAGSSALHGSSQYSGPGPSIGPPRGKEPMNPNGGQMLDFSPALSSQAGSSAQHSSSQDNRDPWTKDESPNMMLLEEINANAPSWFMKFG